MSGPERSGGAANHGFSATIRSLWSAARIPGAPAPFDTAAFKVHYPALVTGSDAERLSGVFQAAPGGPYPVVLILSGINVGQDAYRWLAAELAGAGFAAVTYDWVGPLFAGQVGLTPGVDLALATPDTYGTGPTCQAIAPLLAALAAMHEDAKHPLHGALDLDRVALFGHSAGGTVALQSGRYFPQVKAVAGYGAHNMVSTMLGWPAGTVAPAQVACPVLLMAGTEDGVIAGSADRYGAAAGHDPVTRTFKEALPEGDHRLEVIDGANHFSVADPVDPTAARAFLDRPSTVDGAEARAAIAATLIGFLTARSATC